MKKDSRLKWKIFLMIILFIAFVGLVVFVQHQYVQNKKRAAVLQEQREEELKEKKRLEEKRKEEEKKEQERKEQEQAEKETTVNMQDITITNLNEFATPVLGLNDYLLEEELGKWVAEEKIPVQEAAILEVLIPQSDTQSTEFYLQLGKQDSPVVILTWHVREQIVTISNSIYTAAEIQAGALYGEAPATRDVQEETEDGFEGEN